MSKGLRVLSCIYPRSKLLECNLRNGSHQWLYFQSLMDKFSLFFRGQNFEKAALNIQIWVGHLHNIMILKFYFLWLAAFSLEFNTKILHSKQILEWHNEQGLLGILGVSWRICSGRWWNPSLPLHLMWSHHQYTVPCIFQSLILACKKWSLFSVINKTFIRIHKDFISIS